MYDFYENDFVYLYRIVFNVESINIFVKCGFETVFKRSILTWILWTIRYDCESLKILIFSVSVMVLILQGFGIQVFFKGKC